MSTSIVILADPHWTHQTPRSRRDPYPATQIRKLTWVLEFARTRSAAALVIPGDLFDEPRGKLIRRRLDTTLLPVLRSAPCPIHTIRGNHDLLHDRVDSLAEHPFGVLEAAGVIHPLHWPAHAVVGTDPPVLLLGHDFCRDGPGPWLDRLVAAGALHRLRAATGAGACLALSHAFWGTDGERHGEDVTHPDRLRGTGIDVLAHGHDHTVGGLLTTADGDRELWVVGPGAPSRPGLGWDDRTREPRIGLVTFHADGRREVAFPVIPHEPAEAVFDLRVYERQKAAGRALDATVAALQALGPDAAGAEDPLAAVARETRVSPRVLDRTRDFLNRAASHPE